MDKLKLAHDWAMKSFLTDGFKDEAERANHAWQYADAMQAEADKRVNKERPDVLKEEWQPDWSQAPGEFNWFFKQQDGSCRFSVGKPEFWGDAWAIEAGSYSFESPISCPVDWKDSLRKRPEALCQVDWRQAPSDAAAYIKLSAWDIGAWIDELGIQIEDAPSFGLTGSHVVERPQ